MDELEDGYAFAFPGSDEWTTRLIELVSAERACFPFFAFEPVFEPDLGPALLRVSGPEGVRELSRPSWPHSDSGEPYNPRMFCLVARR